MTKTPAFAAALFCLTFSPMSATFSDPPPIALRWEGLGVLRVEVSPERPPRYRAVAKGLQHGNYSARLKDGWIEVRQKGREVWRGRVLSLDEYGRRRGPGLRVEWAASTNEVLSGLGERFNRLDQSGRWVEMWNRDEPGQGRDGSSSYYCAPVLYSSLGYAFFTPDNPEGEFNLNHDRDGVNSYARIGTRMTFFIACAPNLRELVRLRAQTQGRFRGMPDWVWGPWISRNSYENQAEAEEAIRGMTSRNLPVSAIVQEAWKGPYETGDFNNFSKTGWPDLDSYFALCNSNGIRTILWQVPTVPPSEPEIAALIKKQYFVADPSGAPRPRKAWLEGMLNIDFTRPESVAWWKDQMRDELRMGARGFKADDGEDIEADDVFADGRRGDEMHNEYTALYARALYELMDEERVDGVLWCRSASLGCERTPALWAGDQFATWAQYRSLIPAGLSAGISGAPFWGHDIGGYLDSPSPALYIRWLQFGAFSPLMQFHGIAPREPWHFGEEAERAYRLLTQLRAQLKPYLISLGREAARTGLPLMRPMALEFPDDPRFVAEDSQYMLGPDVLVAPVFEDGASGRRVKFPAGRWRSATRAEEFTGPDELEAKIELLDAPAFVRVGSTAAKLLAPFSSPNPAAP